jgi:hypothetical protein
MLHPRICMFHTYLLCLCVRREGRRRRPDGCAMDGRTYACRRGSNPFWCSTLVGEQRWRQWCQRECRFCQRECRFCQLPLRLYFRGWIGLVPFWWDPKPDACLLYDRTATFPTVTWAIFLDSHIKYIPMCTISSLDQYSQASVSSCRKHHCKWIQYMTVWYHLCTNIDIYICTVVLISSTARSRN